MTDKLYQRVRRTARIPRFYLDSDIPTGQVLTLPKPTSHHLVKVLRMRVEAVVELFNGDGFNYRATLIDTGQQSPGKCASLDVQERYRPETESPLPIQLVQAISSAERMDTTLRQSVELGVSAIQPVYTRHSIKTLDEKRLRKRMDHWQNIVVSACEQSGRTRLPELAEPVELSQWLTDVSDNPEQRPECLYFILAPQAEKSLAHYLALDPNPLENVAVLIGPESGFDADEVDLAVSHGAHAASFGPRILRTETAGPACIASIQSLLGDLGSLTT